MSGEGWCSFGRLRSRVSVARRLASATVGMPRARRLGDAAGGPRASSGSLAVAELLLTPFPATDVINFELALADITQIEKRLERLKKTKGEGGAIRWQRSAD